MIHPERRRENLKKIEEMDREKVIKGLEHCSSSLGCYECPYSEIDQRTIECQLELDRDALELLKELRITGHWIEKEDYNLDIYYDCSECGESWTTIDGTPWQNGMNYCPHCGSRMKLEQS